MRLLIFLTLILSSLRVGAQTKNLDSLKRALQKLELNVKHSTDTNYVNALNELANEYVNKKPDSTLILALRADSLAGRILFSKGKVEALKNAGRSCVVKSQYNDGLNYLTEALRIAKEINYKKGEASVILGIGNIYWILGDLSKALENYFTTLRICEVLGIKDETTAYCLLNLGNIYDEKGNTSESLKFSLLALDNFKLIGKKQGVVAALHNIGTTYFKLGDHASALQNFSESLKLSDEIGDYLNKSYSLIGVADVFVKQQKYDEAIYNYNEASGIANRLDDKYGLSFSLLGLADCYFNLRQYDQASKYAHNSLKISSEINSKDLLRNCNEILSKIYENQGDVTKALHYYKQFKLYADSLTNMEVEKKTANLEAQYAFEKKENALKEEQALRETEHEKQTKLQQFTILGVSIVLSFVLLAAVIQYQSRRKIQKAFSKLEKANTEIQNQKEEIGKQNIRLENQNNQLIKLNEEKNSLIQLVVHDLKTPIHHISGFATILKSEIINANEDQVGFLDKIVDSTTRLNKMIENILNIEAIESGKYEIKYEKIEVVPALHQLVNAFRPQAMNKNIELYCITEGCAECCISADKNYLYQTIENLISNALKFSPNNKKVCVSVKETNDAVTISVKDEGPGINEQDKPRLFGKFQRLSAKPIGEEKSTGLGLSIAKKFTEMMNGRIWCESELGKGAEFIIQFKKKPTAL